jgi:phosphomannomutase
MARDGLATAALLLGSLAVGRPLSSRVADLPELHRVRSTIPCAGGHRGAEILALIAATLGCSLSDPEEGIHVEGERGAWGLVRRSGTEPVLRFTAEASSAPVAKALHERLRTAARAGPR